MPELGTIALAYGVMLFLAPGITVTATGASVSVAGFLARAAWNGASAVWHYAVDTPEQAERRSYADQLRTDLERAVSIADHRHISGELRRLR